MFCLLEKDKIDRFRYFKSCSGAPATSDTTFDDLDVNFQITDKVITEKDDRKFYIQKSSSQKNYPILSIFDSKSLIFKL